MKYYPISTSLKREELVIIWSPGWDFCKTLAACARWGERVALSHCFWVETMSFIVLYFSCNNLWEWNNYFVIIITSDWAHTIKNQTLRTGSFKFDLQYCSSKSEFVELKSKGIISPLLLVNGSKETHAKFCHLLHGFQLSLMLLQQAFRCCFNDC